MKTFILSFFLMTLPVCQTMAQSFSAAELSESLSQTLEAQLLETQSQRGKDRNDSIWTFAVKTFAHPYKTAHDRKKVDEFIRCMQQLYDRCQEQADYSYSMAKTLDTPPSDEALVLAKIFYADDANPFMVGGVGHSFALLTYTNRQNPIYRRVEGIEWWLDTTKVKKPRTCFRVISVSGRKSADAWQANASGRTEDVQEKRQAAELLMKERDSLQQEQLLKEIEGLGKMYHGGDNEFNRAVAQTMFTAIEDYLKLYTDSVELKKLFCVLDKNPYCSAELTSPDGTKQIISFGKLAEIFDSLDVFCHSYEGFDSLSKKKLGNRAKVFLYQIYLNKHVDVSE
ncbi:MAG: hypothetical protein ACI3YD_07915 [Alloprevotella sp.]